MSPARATIFKAIHNSHAREVIAYALQGSFLEKSWIDFDSQTAISCLATRLSDGKIAVFWGPAGSSVKSRRLSAPQPVWISKRSSTRCLSRFWSITKLLLGPLAYLALRSLTRTARRLRDCAVQAQAKNVKALRLRWEKGRAAENAVLFYESIE